MLLTIPAAAAPDQFELNLLNLMICSMPVALYQELSIKKIFPECSLKEAVTKHNLKTGTGVAKFYLLEYYLNSLGPLGEIN